jgi:hypothetical protein
MFIEFVVHFALVHSFQQLEPLIIPAFLEQKFALMPSKAT